ncbi:hypothetical protein BTVI_07376 [Pitangus sulphuratus]|nr:hypothetical protein BTVI_07376 [Pitangus sulphuratus]
MRIVFLAKLLKRLYGETSSSSPVHTSNREEEAVLGNLGSKSKEKNLSNVQTSSADASTSTDTPCKSFQGSDDAIVSPRRIYKVDLPPEGYVAATPDAISSAVSENSGSSADSTGQHPPPVMKGLRESERKTAELDNRVKEVGRKKGIATDTDGLSLSQPEVGLSWSQLALALSDIREASGDWLFTEVTAVTPTMTKILPWKLNT